MGQKVKVTAKIIGIGNEITTRKSMRQTIHLLIL